MRDLLKGITGITLVIACLILYIVTTCGCAQRYTCPTYAGAQHKSQYEPFDDSIGRMAKASQKIAQKAQKENRKAVTSCGLKQRISLGQWVEIHWARITGG